MYAFPVELLGMNKAGPLAVGQQVLYERIAARAGAVVRVEHPDGTMNDNGTREV